MLSPELEDLRQADPLTHGHIYLRHERGQIDGGRARVEYLKVCIYSEKGRGDQLVDGGDHVSLVEKGLQRLQEDDSPETALRGDLSDSPWLL